MVAKDSGCKYINRETFIVYATKYFDIYTFQENIRKNIIHVWCVKVRVLQDLRFKQVFLFLPVLWEKY